MDIIEKARELGRLIQEEESYKKITGRSEECRCRYGASASYR